MEGGINQEALLASEKEEVEKDLEGKIGNESKKIWKIALPGILARVSNFGTIAATQSFVGHISEIDLAAFTFVQTHNLRLSYPLLLYIGIWIGMIIGMFVQTLALIYMIWKTNWDKEVDKATDRIRQFYLKSPEDIQENSDQS